MLSVPTDNKQYPSKSINGINRHRQQGSLQDTDNRVQLQKCSMHDDATYAAALVAARPIARHRPAIMVIEFLFCTVIAMAPLRSLAMIS